MHTPREKILKAMNQTYRRDPEYLLDVVLDTIEENSEQIARSYWPDGWKSDREPWEEGPVSAILETCMRRLRASEEE